MKRLAAALVFAALAVPSFAADAPPSPLPDWSIGDLYATPDAWTASYDKVKAQLAGLDKYKGTLGKSAASMLEAFNALSAINKEAQRLAVYASLIGDEDVRDAHNQERVQLAGDLQTRIGESTAWMTPEILSLGEKKVLAFEAQSPELKKRFGFTLDNTLRAAPHTLGVEAEGVLAATGNVLGQPGNIYSQLANGELPFPSLKLSDGTEIKRLDLQAYSKYRQVGSRADRKLVMDTYFRTYKKFEGTFGQMLTTQVMAAEFNAKARHFPNALSAALFNDNMPEAVYRQLVAQANASLPVFHRYLALRKRLLGVTGELAYYDIYPPMIPLKTPLTYTTDQAKEIALAVTSAYGPEYTALLKKGLDAKWIDAYPRDGKTGDEYMNGAAYDVHPYLHLNYNGDFASLSVYTHEWGHAVHTLLATANQPFENSNYSTFIAETASISNQMLLSDYMVAHAKNDQEKLAFLDKELELIRSTFFRQTMFAEFQLAVHEEMEQGKPLSGSRITEIYCGLLKKYHGADKGVMTIDPGYCSEWSIIPHFYFGFYVWQYATSMAGAAQFTDAIENEGAPARDRYIAMLKAGGSDYPYELYKKAGIDMASPAPYQALVARMTKVMDQIEALEAKK